MQNRKYAKNNDVGLLGEERKSYVDIVICRNSIFPVYSSDWQWLKCKIRGGGTLRSGLGPHGGVSFPSIIKI